MKLDRIPPWLHRATDSVHEDFADTLGRARAVRRVMAVASKPRQAAVLVLFGGSPESDPGAPGGLPADAEVLLTQRASTMRQHRGQVAFPGGAVDPEDSGPIDTALREAWEETGLDRDGVDPVAVLPKLFVPPSRFDVTPVVAYWRNPSQVRVVDQSETERVVRVSMADLLAPANRFVVRSGLGYQSPAFEVDGMLVWGLTGGILAGLISSLGWELDWDRTDVRDLEEALAAVGMTL
ncbi:NUDIX hydrolase [Nocardia donostiensis]|uniref:Coenzyme A pyrophosphatase n=1 Tax=Nocardia donostiensis TaxID=1538463 RepID=A0A1V2TDL2_9NOCA|nr:CoA pyrophosphatase [Nocardia donostiensis]ONM47431.1 coenzyme A pyrophosphatase [Nocardia donostiensis]OQS14339.1 coenzyme A pyrophosphatase [Nocardia donostiensis]OQS24102.1 coenzyme A pyrophosphatase [Nocardia donostiensis]